MGSYFITYSFADEFCIVGDAVCNLPSTKTIEKCDVLTEDSLKIESTFRIEDRITSTLGCAG